MQNKYTIDEVIEIIRYFATTSEDPSDIEYFEKALKIAEDSRINIAARATLIAYVEETPYYTLPNFGEIEGKYNKCYITFDDGCVVDVRLSGFCFSV